MEIVQRFEVARSLRRRSVRRVGDQQPVGDHVLTAVAASQVRAQYRLAREAGATGWMVKPFDPDRLVATIRKVTP